MRCMPLGGRRALATALSFDNCGGEADSDASGRFTLKPSFVNKYAPASQGAPPFGYNGLGELVFLRTYSREVERAGGLPGKERWHETVARVVEGVYDMRRQHMLAQPEAQGAEWDEATVQEEAEEMFDRMFRMKFLPPGRGLWAMGTALTRERKLFAALNNCGFVSTAQLGEDSIRPFAFLMDSAMLGIGVGFDVKGAGQIQVAVPGDGEGEGDDVFVIPDSREGWVDSVVALLEAFFAPLPSDGNIDAQRPKRRCVPSFDYSLVRGAGQPIKGFGGTSQGPGILRSLHESLVEVLSRPQVANQPISVTTIVDVMNLIGKCVVAGNVRRTAEIAFGDARSEEFANLKDYSLNPDRRDYGWTSNNSIYADLGQDYSKVCDKVAINGEPGFAWLDNMQAYGRMCDPPDYKDHRAAGGNPCLEQTLESFEMCCLVETFPAKHSSKADFERTLELALTYAKTVTLGEVHVPETREVMTRNRRIGCSMSGLAQFVTQHGLSTLKEWCDDGYAVLKRCDQRLSEEFGVARSIKLTSIKPSGTVSLLAGATPGLHYPESRFYLRRMRLAADSPLVPALRAAGLSVEPAVGDEERTVVVAIPVGVDSPSTAPAPGEALVSGEPAPIRTVGSVSMWEQLAFASFLQRYWADNQVSCTVTFDPTSEAEQLAPALDHFQYGLKGISFLPRLDAGAYPQMPYESISEEEYHTLTKGQVHSVDMDFSAIYDGSVPGGPSGADAVVPDQFCSSDSCDR